METASDVPGCGVPGCTDPACQIAYGKCHCGCGETTTRARQTDRRLSLVRGEPQRYLRGHANAGRVSAERQARERICARDGCSGRLTPSTDQLKRGGGRYCSRQCYWVAIAKYPQPEARTCAREGCDKPARRVAPAQAAQGKGRYCSRRCADRAKIGRPGRKVLLRCEVCDRERWVRRWYVEHGQRCCSSWCWGKRRWRIGRFSPKLINKEWWSEKAWRFWEGVHYGNQPGSGRPRNDARPDYDETLQMIRDKYDETHASERDLERLTGESRRMVRSALGRSLGRS